MSKIFFLSRGSRKNENNKRSYMLVERLEASNHEQNKFV